PWVSARAAGYTEISYRSGDLRISGYLYQPAGSGPFPTIIYNHGSRAAQERRPVPWVRLAGLYVSAGYAVLVTERRGYGISDGPTWTDAVGRDVTSRFIGRLESEADDVLAAVDFLGAVPFVDRSRLGIVGWSLGGIVTLFAIARSRAFRAAVDQAGGVLTWRAGSALPAALTEAVRHAACPVMLMDAENDAAPEAIPALARAMEAAALPHKMIIYPHYTPPQPTPGIAPGHLVFEADGIPIWGKDALSFLDGYLKP
ncbi:MAG: alpha/beta hydrolase family protein, partial [Stellaceae bacterium]